MHGAANAYASRHYSVHCYAGVVCGPQQKDAGILRHGGKKVQCGVHSEGGRRRLRAPGPTVARRRPVAPARRRWAPRCMARTAWVTSCAEWQRPLPAPSAERCKEQCLTRRTLRQTRPPKAMVCCGGRVRGVHEDGADLHGPAPALVRAAARAAGQQVVLRARLGHRVRAVRPHRRVPGHAAGRRPALLHERGCATGLLTT